MGSKDEAKVYCFYIDEPDKGSCFVAIYSDSSGANVFYRCEDGRYYTVDNKITPPDSHWFADSGYLHFVYFPENKFCKDIFGGR